MHFMVNNFSYRFEVKKYFRFIKVIVSGHFVNHSSLLLINFHPLVKVSSSFAYVHFEKLLQKISRAYDQINLRESTISFIMAELVSLSPICYNSRNSTILPSQTICLHQKPLSFAVNILYLILMKIDEKCACILKDKMNWNNTTGSCIQRRNKGNRILDKRTRI